MTDRPPGGKRPSKPLPPAPAPGRKSSGKPKPEPAGARQELEGVYELDLGKVTGAGWLLLLATVAVGAIGGIVAFNLLQGGANAKLQKPLTFVCCIVPMAGTYLLGRQVMKALGWKMTRD